MKDFDELIFNLFIMAYRYPHYYEYIDEYDYNRVLTCTEFNVIKDCFPVNEICKQEPLVYRGEVFCAQVNYIREE